MNEISIRPATRGSFAQNTPAFLLDHMAVPQPGARAEWLPAPPQRQTSTGAPRPGINTKPRYSPYLTPAHSSKADTFFMALLASLSALAIAYGCSSMLDLVRHWALFNSGIEQLIR
jgi:hypothetical protein